MKKEFTITDLASIFDVTYKTVWSWVENGYLTGSELSEDEVTKNAGTKQARLFTMKDVEKFLTIRFYSTRYYKTWADYCQANKDDAEYVWILTMHGPRDINEGKPKREAHVVGSYKTDRSAEIAMRREVKEALLNYYKKTNGRSQWKVRAVYGEHEARIIKISTNNPLYIFTYEKHEVR